MGRIRKQVYLDSEQEQKLRDYAARWRSSEADVIRIALDRLTDLDRLVTPGTADSAVMVDDFDDDEPLSDQELDVLEAENETWFREHPQPLGLSEAVFLDREGR